jgi:hypothetical protein
VRGVPAGAVALASDTAALLGLVLAVPFVMLAVGLPIVLLIQLLLWMGRLVA